MVHRSDIDELEANAAWQELRTSVEARHVDVIGRLLREDDLLEIGRLQGQADALTYLLSFVDRLREELEEESGQEHK